MDLPAPAHKLSASGGDLIGSLGQDFDFYTDTLTPTALNTQFSSFIRYYDQNTRNHIDVVNRGVTWQFVIANTRAGLWAFAVNPVDHQSITAVQLTDFKLTNQGLDLSAIDTDRGILYCLSHSSYRSRKSSRVYVQDPLCAWLIAINARKLLRDSLSGRFVWDAGAISGPSQASNYFVSLGALPRRCNVPLQQIGGQQTHLSGWGTVYDHSRERLLFATTDLRNGKEGEPRGSRLYALNLKKRPRFSSRGKDKRKAQLLLDERDLPIHDPRGPAEDASHDVAIAHLMINPWNENIVALDNYAGDLYGSVAANSAADYAPSRVVYFDFSMNANRPHIFHFNLPGPNSVTQRDRAIGHHSFISATSFVGIDDAQVILADYPHGKGFIDTLPAGYLPDIAVATDHQYFKQWWPSHEEGDDFLFSEPEHITMSPNRLFLVQDSHIVEVTPAETRRVDYDRLLLWFRTAAGYSCYTVVKGNHPLDNETPIDNKYLTHPHAVFIDNQSFLYNATVQPEVDQGVHRRLSEVRQVTIPREILGMDLLPLGE